MNRRKENFRGDQAQTETGLSVRRRNRMGLVPREISFATLVGASE
jgi:hypothetical protein